MSINVQKIITSSIQNNSYLIKKQNTAIIIDPSFDTDLILEEIQGFESVDCLLTHGHYDHIAGLSILESSLDNFTVYIHQNDQEFLKNEDYNLSLPLFNKAYSYKGDYKTIKNGDILNLLGYSIQCLHTPGHTPGGTCFYFDSEFVVFTGDTLFFHSLGRTDFPLSNTENLRKSIKQKLFTLPEKIVVYPGHGKNTSIGEEIRNNSFI